MSLAAALLQAGLLGRLAELGVDASTAAAILEELQAPQPLPAVPSAADMLARRADRGPEALSSGCPELDALLGGGARRGQVTEISGAPGVGKSTLCLTFCVSAVRALGSAVVLDCEGGFSAQRLADLAGDAAEVLAHTRVWRCTTAAELLSAVAQLGALALERPLRLVVLDSVAALMRHGDERVGRDLPALVGGLRAVAHGADCAVVATNALVAWHEGGEEVRRPALGVAWAQACGTRLVLEWPGAALPPGAPPLWYRGGGAKAGTMLPVTARVASVAPERSLVVGLTRDGWAVPPVD